MKEDGWAWRSVRPALAPLGHAWAGSALTLVPRSTAHYCVTLGMLINLGCDLGYVS